jgi:hypothetical protein
MNYTVIVRCFCCPRIQEVEAESLPEAFLKWEKRGWTWQIEDNWVCPKCAKEIRKA